MPPPSLLCRWDSEYFPIPPGAFARGANEKQGVSDNYAKKGGKKTHAELDFCSAWGNVLSSQEIESMKISIVSMMMAAVIGLMTTAQAELKVASVNMQELYKKYYKRFEAEKRLSELKASIDKDVAARQEKLQALMKAMQEIRKKDDPALTENARKAIQTEFQMKQNTAQAEEQEYKSFVQRKQMAFQEAQKSEILTILQEIQKIVEDAAAKVDCDLLIDSAAAAPPMGTKAFPYVKKNLDITPEILKILNASAPAGFDPDKPAGGISAAAVQ